jgi:adenylate cyclase
MNDNTSGVMNHSVVSLYRRIVEAFLRLPIRFKLSLLVGVSLTVVVLTISIITVERQENQLREQTEILGKNIVQNLADIAKENLLLSSSALVQEHVVNIVRRNVPGLEMLLVVDMNGKFVAHSIVDSVNHHASIDIWEKIVGVDSLTRFETGNHLQYVEPIAITKAGESNESKILIGGALVSFSKQKVLAPIETMKSTFIVMSAVVTAAAIFIVFLVAGRVVQIIVALSDAARLVGLGHLQVKVSTRIKDEIGVLAGEFNLMVRQIREKSEMEKFVSRSIVEMLSEGKEATLGGARRVVTVMFTDIRNFTSVTESLWPEETVELLNTYLDLQTKIIQEYKGVVDKFLGDGIMALFAGPEMAHNAVRAALKIQRRIARVNLERKRRKEIYLEVGIGITTGHAVMGSIGSRERMDYTVIGDIVNLASRLCAVADPNEIVVSGDVVSRLNGEFRISAARDVSLKGKKDTIPVYQIEYSLD